MRLFKILDSIEKSIAVFDEAAVLTKGVERLEQYSKVESALALPVRDLRITNKTATIGGDSVLDVSRNLRLGYVDFLKKVYKVDELPRPLITRAEADVKNLSSFSIGNNERLTTEFKSRVREKMNKRTFNELNTADSVLTEKAVRENPVLNDICESMKNKKFITITGTELIVGAVGTVFVIAVINEHLAKMRGCYAYYMGNDQVLKNCKIQTCSCDGKGGLNQQCGTLCDFCTSDLLDKLPDSMKRVDNCKDTTKPCVQCPSADFNVTETPDLDQEQQLAVVQPRDQIFIRCNNPSVWDAISDIFGNAGDNLINIVDGAANAISWFLRNLPKILIYGGILFLLAILFGFTSKISGLFKGGGDNYEPPPQEDRQPIIEEVE